MAGYITRQQMREMMDRHELNKNQPVRTKLKCPVCSRDFVKEAWNQIFCLEGKKRGRVSCNDVYWNIVKPRRLTSLARFSAEDLSAIDDESYYIPEQDEDY